MVPKSISANFIHIEFLNERLAIPEWLFLYNRKEDCQYQKGQCGRASLHNLWTFGPFIYAKKNNFVKKSSLVKVV